VLFELLKSGNSLLKRETIKMQNVNNFATSFAISASSIVLPGHGISAGFGSDFFLGKNGKQWPISHAMLLR
jgi:hypothetical protein